MENSLSNITPLFEGRDVRLKNLRNDILDMVLERGQTLPYAAIIGILEIVKDDLIEQMRE